MARPRRTNFRPEFLDEMMKIVNDGNRLNRRAVHTQPTARSEPVLPGVWIEPVSIARTTSAPSEDMAARARHEVEEAFRLRLRSRHTQGPLSAENEVVDSRLKSRCHVVAPGQDRFKTTSSSSSAPLRLHNDGCAEVYERRKMLRQSKAAKHMALISIGNASLSLPECAEVPEDLENDVFIDEKPEEKENFEDDLEIIEEQEKLESEQAMTMTVPKRRRSFQEICARVIGMLRRRASSHGRK
ncbi:unnamed protein product, partial [Mesorhabditis spiculigera]